MKAYLLHIKSLCACCIFAKPKYCIMFQVIISTANMSLISVEECELMNDSKYRAYISQVEKALRSFEYTSEWADLISALGKLNKVCY